MMNVKSFTTGINRVFSSNGGVMWEKLNNAQLRHYLISELEKFECQTDRKRKKAALNIGRQPESDIYVFNDSVQVRSLHINTIKIEQGISLT